MTAQYSVENSTTDIDANIANLDTDIKHNKFFIPPILRYQKNLLCFVLISTFAMLISTLIVLVSTLYRIVTNGDDP